MKNLVLTICIVCTLISVGFAQDRQANKNKIKALKIAHITDQIELDSKQAEKFWPLYNDFDAKRFDLRKQTKALINDDDNESDEEELKDQEQILKLRQKELDLSKEYRERFLKVLSPVQYSKLLEAERNFNAMLLNKLKERKK